MEEPKYELGFLHFHWLALIAFLIFKTLWIGIQEKKGGSLVDGSFSGDKEMSREEKCKVLPTLQLHLMYSPPLLSLLQPQCVCVCVCEVASVVSNSFVTPWTVAFQVPLSLGFSEPETNALNEWGQGSKREKRSQHRLHDWADHHCGQWVDKSPRTFWES